MQPSHVTALHTKHPQVVEKGAAPTLHSSGLAADQSPRKPRHRGLAFTQRSTESRPGACSFSSPPGAYCCAGHGWRNPQQGRACCKDSRWVWQQGHLCPRVVSSFSTFASTRKGRHAEEQCAQSPCPCDLISIWTPQGVGGVSTMFKAMKWEPGQTGVR